MTLELGQAALYVTLMIWIDNTGHSCGDKLFVADAGNGTIYIAESNGFSFVNATFKALNLSHMSDPIGIDYDPRNDMIYWTDEALHTVNRGRLDGSFQEVIVQVSQYFGYPQGIVLDLVENNVYWTDPYFRVIEVANLDGTKRRPVVNSGLEIPRAITLSNKRRKLFWTDRGSEPKIEMSNMDGSQRIVIVTNNIVHPNGIALDFSEQRLYWTDTFRNSIESTDLDDFSIRFIHLEFVFESHPFGVMLYYEDIYFSEFGSHRVYEIDFPDGDITDLGFVLSTPTEVHIYADRSCPSADFCPGQSTCNVIRRQPMLVTECSCLPGYGDTRCSDIDECLATGVDYPCDAINGVCLNTDGSYQCTCDRGYELVGSGPNCTDIDECQAVSSPCSSNEICRNEDGGYSCECETGYERQSDNCLDINECRLGSPCGANEDCFNTDGNYTCSCSFGFEMKNDACLALNSVQGSLRFTHLNGVPITFTDGLRNRGSDEFHNMERTCFKVIRNQALFGINLEVVGFEVIEFLEGSIVANFIIEIYNSNQALSRQQAETIFETLQSNDPGVWSSSDGSVSLTVSSITVNVIGDACRSSPCQFGTCRSVESDYLCDCQPGYKGLLCDTVITCSLPADPLFGHIENPRGTYNGGDRITITCDDNSDSVSWTCDFSTGLWSQNPIDCGRKTQDFPVMIIAIIGAVAGFIVILVITGIVLCVRAKRRRPTTDDRNTEISSLPPCNYYETSLSGAVRSTEMNYDMLNPGFDPIYESLPDPVDKFPTSPRALSANGHTSSVSSAVGAVAARSGSDQGVSQLERPPSYSVEDPLASGGRTNLYERAILPSKPRDESSDFTATTMDNDYLEVLE